MSVSILGHAIQRVEDPALLRGAARYVADLEVEGTLHACFVRSSVAHARLTSVDVEDAAKAPGVVAVLVASDLDLPGLGEWPLPPERFRQALIRPCLATDRIRFVGEPYAVVLAETEAAAVDAAELVAIDYEELPVVVDPLAAIEPDAPVLFPEHGSNVVLDLPPDDDGDVLEGSDVVIRDRFRNQRLAPVPMEPNGALAVPEPDGGLTVWVSSQSVHGVRDSIAWALGLAETAVRVVAPAVGGGFGAKGGTYPEQLVVAAAALRLRRPVRWVETRSENLLAMTHGRGQVQDFELGARRDGTIVGLRATTVTEVGAYSWRGLVATRLARTMGSGVYRIPRISLRSMAVATNTTPVGPYRGAGRPEAAAMLERAMDLLAAELDLDPAELRRRNLLRPDEFPYTTPTGASYDSGDYLTALERALEVSDYKGLRAEQEARRRGGGGRALGIGISCFVEVSGVGGEYGSVAVEHDGTVTVRSGASAHGQGHHTTFAQVAASVLGVPFDKVVIVQSDTAAVSRGVGTFGSRSGQLGGSAVVRAGEVVLEKARNLAAHLLEAHPEDVVQDGDGRFGVAGVPARSLSWGELALAAEEIGGLPEGMAPGLAAEADFTQETGTYPFGTHVAVVEVDLGTGHVELRRIVAVDDCGVVMNPLVVTGQVHGGLAQGVAQALYESVEYDGDGNPLTSTLAEYLFPSAADLPSWELDHTVTSTPRNPLGAKGVGEAGTVGSTPAVWNAVLDALRPYGIRHLDMPLSPARVWGALVEAGAEEAGAV
ncbi:MAG: xanthine dehydrogenase family protein molybdopterin-binding subunit [Acidimicrobiales bacterium]